MIERRDVLILTEKGTFVKGWVDTESDRIKGVQVDLKTHPYLGGVNNIRCIDILARYAPIPVK
ncbi:MAG: hypothetical protein A2860_01110 [Candidatus Levybacteria bacterium RIFCSPHIGHO2_01_FULL_37_33]|nr:MAG: hypothetical protein A3J17_01355 [Candidatus Curtissbacteria bacterium RIFCSPLOWO2_02_FULL_40_11]OGH14680.1 MAG: hypothetical protein A2860_01110 [Candidatus Levybacteria bacterium RIFCSPHIGHO2_01_FULL_37_33]